MVKRGDEFEYQREWTSLAESPRSTSQGASEVWPRLTLMGRSICAGPLCCSRCQLQVGYETQYGPKGDVTFVLPGQSRVLQPKWRGAASATGLRRSNRTLTRADIAHLAQARCRRYRTRSRQMRLDRYRRGRKPVRWMSSRARRRLSLRRGWRAGRTELSCTQAARICCNWYLMKHQR